MLVRLRSYLDRPSFPQFNRGGFNTNSVMMYLRCPRGTRRFKDRDDDDMVTVMDVVINSITARYGKSGEDSIAFPDLHSLSPRCTICTRCPDHDNNLRSRKWSW